MDQALIGWDDRLAWSGETPFDYPGLNPVAALRFNGHTAGTWPDAVDPANIWTFTNAAGVGYTRPAGQWGEQVAFNVSNPATEQGRISLPFFPGLWPSSGRLLLALWVKQNYTMSFNPLLSTRAAGTTPVAYLSTNSLGRLRHSVYGATGAAVVDQYEDAPWGATTGWQWVGMLVDLDAKTSQLAAVNAATHTKFVGPLRTLSGAANPASEAPLDIFSLQSAGYWTGGNTDEVMVAHPGAGFDLTAYAEQIRLGTWASAAGTSAAGKLTVTDLAVEATAAGTFTTGARQATWDERPEPTPAATPSWSTDDGATWQTGQLPATFTGLVRWDVPLATGDTFTRLTLLPPAPTLAAIPDQAAEQNDTLTVSITGTTSGAATWNVTAPGVAANIIGGAQLVISTGWAAGAIPVTVTIRDTWGRIASRTFALTVTPAPWAPPAPAAYPRAPIIIRGADGNDEVIIDALSAVDVHEVNGEHSFEFSIPVGHRHAGAIRNEAGVELAGEHYRVRRVTTGRKGRAPVLTAYCEAEFYDLAYAGELPARDYLQTTAGAAMQDALAGTGWTIGRVTVTTRRTYSVEESNPLSLLRTIQQQHGGDLLFDSTARTVSLVVRSGRDVGVSFFYGRGLTESKRVVDTTSLVTRIYARNADGATIASVNGGKAYVEDYTWTSEVREATYDFAAGTSPWTMLSMVQATLANRSRPAFSYEFTVADLSYRSGQPVDRFDVGDMVTVVDDELGIREAQRILRVEHDVVRPWASRITLSGKLRESGNAAAEAAGALSTGSQFQAFDLVPYNLLHNGRFDNALAHWAASGVEVVPGSGTGDNAVRFAGSGLRWIEQTVHPDNRDVYALSLDAAAVTGGEVPPLSVVVTVEYEDGTSEAIPVELT
ncbi:phage tail spike protein [Microbacterium sp.]|uniref:phage tail spike protein n=1 Tax=Microbacterium sp. TaxID=51671 RepID=UPI003A908370